MYNCAVFVQRFAQLMMQSLYIIIVVVVVNNGIISYKRPVMLSLCPPIHARSIISRIQGSLYCHQSPVRICKSSSAHHPLSSPKKRKSEDGKTHSNSNLKNHTSMSSFLIALFAHSRLSFAIFCPSEDPSVSWSMKRTASSQSSPCRLSGT